MVNVINLSTAGVHLKYAVETTAGTRPTTGYVDLPGVKSTPSLNPAPETLETTSLNETEWKTYINGLKDLGGSLSFTFNLTEAFMGTWDTLMSAYEAGKSASNPLGTWFVVIVPGLSKSFYFKGEPSELGLPEMSVNSVLETTVYITPTDAPVIAAKPTE